jgi:hypothetical protein
VLFVRENPFLTVINATINISVVMLPDGTFIVSELTFVPTAVALPTKPTSGVSFTKVLPPFIVWRVFVTAPVFVSDASGRLKV